MRETLLVFFIAFIMIVGGLNHLFNPHFYNNFIPDIFPKLLINYASAAVEIIIGILVIVPKMRKFGALTFIGLMFIFFPIHIWDFLKETPAIGSKTFSAIRLVIQFIFIALGYSLFKKNLQGK